MKYEFYGITQNPETKSYLMILNNKCYPKYLQQNFENWTSGNNNIDRFMQNFQLSEHNFGPKALEWIPYNRFYNIKYVGFGKLYRAKWIDGYIEWDNKHQNWIRQNQNMLVILKSLDPKNITLEFMNEVKLR
jgi:hypothetical protein